MFVLQSVSLDIAFACVHRVLFEVCKLALLRLRLGIDDRRAECIRVR